jgi:hypothetical protein
MKHVSGHKTAHAWHGDMVTWTPAPLWPYLAATLTQAVQKYHSTIDIVGINCTTPNSCRKMQGSTNCVHSKETSETR